MNVRTITALGTAALAVGLITGCATKPAENASATASPSASASASPFHSDTVDEAIASAKAEESAEAQSDLDEDIADLHVLMGYQNVIDELQTAFRDAKSASDTYDMDAIKDVGGDFMRIGQDGLALDDIPDESYAANESWDATMRSLSMAGVYMQLGDIEQASAEMQDVSDGLDAAKDALT